MSMSALSIYPSTTIKMPTSSWTIGACLTKSSAHAVRSSTERPTLRNGDPRRPTQGRMLDKPCRSSFVI
jgi:hypothetical protein